MPSPLADLLIGGLTEANKKRQQNAKFQKDMFLAIQKAKLAGIDYQELLAKRKFEILEGGLKPFTEDSSQQAPIRQTPIRQPQGGKPQKVQIRQPIQQPLGQQQQVQGQQSLAQPQQSLATPTDLQQKLLDQTRFQHEFERIPDGVDANLLPKFKTVETARSKLFFKQLQENATKRAESIHTRKNAIRMQMSTTTLIMGAMAEIGQLYAEAYREGGVGSLTKEKVSDLRLRLGGRQAEDLPATDAFPGLKTEVVSRLMPALTQQGDKLGSVRLVETVFRKVEKTLPSKNTPLLNARKMIRATIRNTYRFSRAARQLGLTNEFVDLSIEANRRKFIDAIGKPVDLGVDGSTPTGTAPLIFLSGTTIDWHTNKGSGGGFTEVGALTTATTSPSD